ncbi:MAG TPA: hypothetical protein VM100_04705 [Longimicrobiales bacterium]|nr:hypothetical protein [Longimicrobiales bacterium]
MRKTFLALSFTALFALPAAAQNVSIDRLREELAQEKDIATLRKREFELNRRGSTSTEAMIERGMVLVRLYEMTRDDKDAKQAGQMFDRAKKKLPTDARVFYGMALSRTAGYGVRIPSPLGAFNGIATAQSIAEIIKRDPVSLAKNDLKQAITLEPNLFGAAIELARLSLDTRDHDNMLASAVILRRMVAANVGGVRTATALSQIEEGLGNVQAAARAAETASDLITGNDNTGAASASHAHAVALLRQPERVDAGARAYFAGVDQLTDETAQAYYNAVRPIASERETASWETGDLAFKKEWLKRFWNVRAAASGVTVAERMAEHFKRLAAAQDKFRATGKRGAAPGGSLVREKYAKDDLPFDDRGLIYVRHGAPTEVVKTTHVDLRPNETWVYRINNKNILYNFIVLRDGTDFRLVDDLLIALDPSTRNMPTDAAAKLLRDRQSYEPRYAAMAQRFDNMDRAERMSGFTTANAGEDLQSVTTAQKRIAFDMRQQALNALVTDSDRPDFNGDLPFWYDLYAFKGVKGLTDVTVAAAVPGSSLFSQRRGDQYVYSVQASLIFIDTTTNEITRRDSIFNFWSSRVLGNNEHLRIALDMSVPVAKAGMHRMVVRDLTNPGVGQLYGGPSEIKNFTGQSLMVSDLILADADDGKWHRGLANLGLVPPRQFEEKKPLKIFYELYNLANETPYRTEISMTPVEGAVGFGRLKKLFGGRSGTIHLQFDGVAQANADGTVQELRQVSAEAKPGKYRVEVRVTNLQNQQSVRTETVFLVGNMKK